MKIIQIKLTKMATFCYLVGDKTTKTCALIDPAFETKKILKIAKSENFRITHVINTHCHSDHTAGNADIIKNTGAQLCIHKTDSVKLTGFINRSLSRILGGKKSPVPDILLEDNDIIEIGKTKIKVILTPGHTKGSICLYSGGNLFTGDTLFVETVGRSDLPGGSFKEIANSIKSRLYTLDNNTIVWPGHDYGSTPHSTIGYEKNNNCAVKL